MHGHAEGGRSGEDGGEEMQLSSCTHSKCSRRLVSGVRTEEVRERVGERYKRETLMGLTQINIAQ
jgi:hypothetical protein